MKKMRALFLLSIWFGMVIFSCGKENNVSEVPGSSDEEEIILQEIILQEITEEESAQKREEKISATIKDFVLSLPEVQRYSQLFLVNLEGNSEYIPVEYTPDGDLLVPGGYIFFSYNIADTPQKVADFTASVQEYCTKETGVPVYLTLDQEGGDVSRLRGITSPLPSASAVAKNMTAEEARELYSLQGKQMAELGFHLNLAPVAEPATEENKNFLGTRSFGSAQQVLDYCQSFIAGFQQEQVGTVVKHFPGNTNVDPHSGLPEIPLSEEELTRQYLNLFKSVLEEKPWGILMSHARTAAYDKDTPACLSSFWVTDVLKNTYGYEGLVLSDDIFMAALEKNRFPPEKAAVMAVEAGIDVIMLSEKLFYPTLDILVKKSREDAAFKEKLDRASEQVIKAKIRMGLLELRENQGEFQLQVASPHVFEETVFTEAYEAGVELYNRLFNK